MSGVRKHRYRGGAGSKMGNEDNCFFDINLGDLNQKYFNKNGKCANCAGSP